jgi:uncharacterized cupin superfamily protein
MSYSKGHYNFDKENDGPSDFALQLGLKNLGFSVYVLTRGEGFDFFHSHREQEEIYYCIDGVADLIILNDDKSEERIILNKGDIVRIDPPTLRAIGNQSSDRTVLVISGACAHSYPAGFGHHDVIADVLSVTGKGTTGFKMPQAATKPSSDEDGENL